MPRHARLDAPEVLPHVLVRSLERRSISAEDLNRAALVARGRHALGGSPGEVRASGDNMLHMATHDESTLALAASPG
jgi:hypothetical protein